MSEPALSNGRAARVLGISPSTLAKSRLSGRRGPVLRKDRSPRRLSPTRPPPGLSRFLQALRWRGGWRTPTLLDLVLAPRPIRRVSVFREED